MEQCADVGIGAHRWGRSHVVKSLEASVDIFTVSKQLGHSDIGVTTGHLFAVNARKLWQLAVSPLGSLGK